MAKNKPGLQVKMTKATAPQPEPQPEVVEEPQPPILTSKIVEIHLGEVSDSEYLSRHVEARLTTRDQQLAWKRLLRGLQQQGAKTNDGRAVQRPGEALRWLIERISESD